MKLTISVVAVAMLFLLLALSGCGGFSDEEKCQENGQRCNRPDREDKP